MRANDRLNSPVASSRYTVLGTRRIRLLENLKFTLNMMGGGRNSCSAR